MTIRIHSTVLFAAWAACVAGCEPPPVATTCTVTKNDDGSATITCPDGSIATVHNGVDGQTGKNGTDGVKGADGQPGARGVVGANGATGPAGSNGTDGTDGTSCSVRDLEPGVHEIFCTDGTSVVLRDAVTGEGEGEGEGEGKGE